MLTRTTHSERFLVKNFKCTAYMYHFSIRLKLKAMGESCCEYCATPSGVDKVIETFRTIRVNLRNSQIINISKYFERLEKEKAIFTSTQTFEDYNSKLLHLTEK